MKRIIIAILAAFAMTLAYYVVALNAGPIIIGGPPMTIPAALYIPISLPSLIYRSLVPDSIQMATLSSPGVEPLLFFVGNVLLVSVIIYALIRLTSRTRPK